MADDLGDPLFAKAPEVADRGCNRDAMAVPTKPPVELHLSLFSLPPIPGVRGASGARDSTRVLTRLKILVGVVAPGVVREEPSAARAFLEALERSSLHERDRASVSQLVRAIAPPSVSEVTWTTGSSRRRSG